MDRTRRVSRTPVAITAIMALVALLLVGFPSLSSAQTPTQVSIGSSGNAAKPRITGILKTVDGQPVPQAAIAISIDGAFAKTVETSNAGAFEAQVGLPEGDHTVTASFAGDGQYAASNASIPIRVKPSKTTAPTNPDPTATATEPSKPAPPASATMTARPDAPSVPADGLVGVSGSLTYGGKPIDGARVDIATSWGGVTSIAVTNSSGDYSATLALPGGSGFPASLNITVTYRGDAQFPAGAAVATVAVTAPSPSPTPTPEEETPTPSPTASASASASAQVAPDPVQSQDAVAVAAEEFTRATPALIGVAVASVIVLLLLWMLAWSQHWLMPGERRGFGSDFGQRRPTSNRN